MTALRQEAYRMMEAMPEKSMAALIRYMTEYNRKLAEREARIEKNRQAFDDLMSLCKEVPADRNNDEELAKSREERFGNENIC